MNRNSPEKAAISAQAKNMRYIIIGYGNIGRKRQTALHEKCVATVDPISEDADYKDYKDVPTDTYDAVILSVPNAAKISILEYLLHNKKHVLVEKPLLFPDEAVAQHLYSKARSNGVIWYTAYNHRFEPNVLKIKELLENGAIGKPYFASFTYGNGTVKNLIGTWRDSGFGVFEDLGCHVMDLAQYLLPDQKREYKLICAGKFEAKSPDYCSFSTEDGSIQFLCSTLLWKNTFRIEIFGSKGSLHLDGLNKWGGSRLTLRERVLPSGIPTEKNFESSGEDVSWARDIAHFEQIASLEESSYKNDLHIFRSLNALASEFIKRQKNGD